MELFLFTKNLDLAKRAESVGIDSVIIDWENRGKDVRQKGYDLETNINTVDDVKSLSSILKIPISVRINPLDVHTRTEIDSAIDNGAKIIMLPMAKTISELEHFIKIVNRRAKTIVQIETVSLSNVVGDMLNLEWDYAYIGLNDLMVAKGKHSIWEALLDGTAENICSRLAGRRYGFGGSTVIGGGRPIINILILHELIRLGGSISVMRRTFKTELLDRNLESEINVLRHFIECSEKRGKLARQYDYEHLCTIIKKIINFQEVLF